MKLAERIERLCLAMGWEDSKVAGKLGKKKESMPALRTGRRRPQRIAEVVVKLRKLESAYAKELERYDSGEVTSERTFNRGIYRVDWPEIRRASEAREALAAALARNVPSRRLVTERALWILALDEQTLMRRPERSSYRGVGSGRSSARTGSRMAPGGISKCQEN